MATVNFEIPEEIAVVLNAKDEVLSRNMKLYASLQLFHEHTLSLGQAAKMADMNKLEFMKLCGLHNISVIDYSEKELEEELEIFKS